MKRFRIPLISLTVALVYVGLLGNLYRLQIQKNDYYTAQAASQYQVAGFLEPARGSIYFTDRNNNQVPVAMNKEYPVIFAVPTEITDPAAAAAVLAPIFSLDQTTLTQTLSRPKDQYEVLAHKATDAQVAAVQNLPFKGVYIDKETLRSYPFGSLAASVLGFVAPTAENPQPSGRYGLEEYYNTELSGTPGSVEGNKLVGAVSGQDLRLTLDINIQSQAEQILQGLVEKYKAAQGMFIVEEPKTGKIIAMGNYPTFDPNNYGASPLSSYVNPTIQGVYEPGSVMKLVTMSAGIDTNTITPFTAFFDSGSLTLNGKTIYNANFEHYGKTDMVGVIDHSINMGAAFVENLLGPDRFYNYLVKFGFGQKTGIELPGEVGGNISNLTSSYRAINFADASFGQGVSVTPIQMIDAVGAIANGGTLMRPYLLQNEQPQVISRVIATSTAQQVAGMMVHAVNTNAVAVIPNFNVAGKTGTSQIPDFVHGGYTQNYIHNFIGFAPATNPRFIILMRLDNPDETLAGYTVVEPFAQLAEYMLNYYNIPPDNLGGNNILQP
ncbi:penicillin-binding protein 2 [Patescibacteria group bacterium]|nr:penicillin-binding protein 2 [Patescibacteria group bacterium]